MPGFTPYSAPSWEQASTAWNSQGKSGMTPYPDYQRYGGDWSKYEQAYYDKALTDTWGSRNTAYEKFFDAQRRKGVGDSPISDTLWGEKYEPKYAQSITDASNAAQMSRAQNEMTDLFNWDKNQATKAQYGNSFMDSWITNYLNQDASNWNANTTAGRNAMLDARGQNKSDDWTEILQPAGSIIGAIIGSYYGGPVGGQIGGRLGGNAGTQVGGLADGNQSWDQSLWGLTFPSMGSNGGGMNSGGMNMFSGWGSAGSSAGTAAGSGAGDLTELGMAVW